MHRQSFTRRRLPHWDVPDAAYFLTTCLEGSIPAQGRLDLERHRDELAHRPRPELVTPGDWQRRLWKLRFARRETWLDTQAAVRHLADPRLAQVVVDSLYWYSGKHYDLLAFAIMPSHVHWVFQPLREWLATLPESPPTPRQRIQHSVNRYTAVRCNQLLGATGSFWQRESYDHWVRDADELERIIRYVEANPVKAGLATAPELWPFSSAYDRSRWDLPFGIPLTKRA